MHPYWPKEDPKISCISTFNFIQISPDSTCIKKTKHAKDAPIYCTVYNLLRRG
jgi:hypothetical protein